MTPTRTLIMRRTGAVAALAAAAAFAAPATAGAAATPSLNGTTLTVTGDDTADAITIAEANGKLTVNGSENLGGGATAPADNTIDLVLNSGGGDDTITVATANLKSVTADGQAGDDLLTGNNDADALRGGDGDDRVTGAKGDDDMEGGAGNDVLVWNNGDNSDTMDGDAGADEIEVNGAATAGDVFTINPSGSRVDFDRTNLVPFSLDVSAERMAINGLGGGDSVTGAQGLAPLVALALNGGTGADSITGGDGADLITGGDAVDTLDGAGGGDRVIGDRGNDVMGGGTGDDTLVWNNGDNSDRMDGGDGLDRIEVNGAGAGDVFTIAPNGGRARFDRTNLVPFTLDIGSAEALDARGQGGNDSLAAQYGTGSLLAVTADGGAGDDVLTGAEEADSLFGGSGNDQLTGGAGPDLLDGQDGDDTLRARDGQSDLARGGAGADAAQTDALGVDVWDGIEAVDAPVIAPVAPAPAPDAKATAVGVGSKRAAVRLRGGRASTRLALSCPAAEAGGCAGTLTLVSAKPVRIGSQRVIVVLGSARYSLGAGQRRTVTVKLPKGVRKLASKGAIAARAQTVTRDAAGNTAAASRAVSLRLPKQR